MIKGFKATVGTVVLTVYGLVIIVPKKGARRHLRSDNIQALIDAPDMVRCQINFKRLSLTDIKINISSVFQRKL
ncbi:hypothetical protein GUJ93_ZPchr0009g1273 [Zizania palustris]|uniref:Uncharacterized protein n=1 Tax=Zizania palustris TaxID=103762 RepID=A0A8J5RX51_ZIZPA|nr:hypothetical protein GUJ93_ZPchr0009g1273 [Zizania palustris]